MSDRNTSSRTIRYYLSPMKVLKGNWPVLLVILPVLGYYRSQKLWLKLLSFLVAIPFLLLVTAVIPTLYHLLFRIPMVEINERGISYNVPAVWFINLGMSIRWEEIAAIYVNELTMQRPNRTRVFRALAILPNERESFAQREKIQSIRRFPIWGFLAATKTPFMFFEGVTAPTPLEDVLALIKNNFGDKLQENGIEIRDEQQTTFPL